MKAAAMVKETATHVYTHVTPLRVDAWRKGKDSYTWESCRYVPVTPGYSVAQTVLELEGLMTNKLVTLSFIVSGVLHHRPVEADKALDECLALFNEHASHLKHIAVYDTEERLWLYQNRTRKTDNARAP